MGTCCSTPAVAGRPSRTYSGPLPAPMQDQVNAVLNRWRHGEVNLLARKFRQAPPPLKRRGLTREGLAAVFPLLTRLPEASREAAFAVFDSQGRGTVDFRDFCRALALCSRGTRLERLRFLFDLF
ncbi:unnamed protein product, partial [Phaeothamnion confervicola]